MSVSYQDIVNGINDRMVNTNFSTNRGSEILRAVNTALDRINIGDTGEDKGSDVEVGYDFQRETSDISFVDGTETYPIDLDTVDLKFANRVLIQTDRTYDFTYRDPDYFDRKVGVYSSNERMFTLKYDGGTLNLHINYDTTDTLDFEFFSNALVADSDGTNRSSNFSSNDGTRILLIPDNYKDVVIMYACSDLANQLYNDKSTQSQKFEAMGIRILKRMISSIGTVRKRPIKQFRIRNEWPAVLRSTRNN